MKLSLANADFVVSSIKKTERTRKAPTAFTTSTMQQEASKKLGFQTQRTMRAAQQLYEGVDIEGMGADGVFLHYDSIKEVFNI